MSKGTDQHPSVLIVTTEFPPATGSGVLRLLGLTRQLVNLGWNVTVLTPTSSAHGCDLLEYVPETVSVLRTARRRFSGAVNAPLPKDSRVTRFLRRAARMAARTADSVFYPPLGETGWVASAVKAGMPLAEGCDVILSSYGPDSAHMVALRLHEKTGKPWVADFRDPYLDNPQIFSNMSKLLYRNLPKRLERRFIMGAAHIVTTTESLAQLFAKRYDLPQDRISVVANGYDLDIFSEDGTPTSEASKVFTLAFLGTAYDPTAFEACFQGISNFLTESSLGPDRFMLQLIGGACTSLRATAAAAGLTSHVKFIPQVGHRRAVELMRSAAALLVVREEMFESLCIPAKIFQYMRAGRPVLCVANGGPLRDICERHHLGPCVSLRDPQETQQAVSSLYQKHSKGTLSDAWIPIDIEKYDRRQLGAHLSRILFRALTHTSAATEQRIDAVS